MGKHKCICRSSFCHGEGGEASVRVPKDPETREEWRKSLFADDSYSFGADPRVSLVHFPPSSLHVDTECSSPDGRTVGVGVVPGALPNQPDASMEELSKGALERSLRWRAKADRHQQALLRANVALASLRAKVKEKDKIIQGLEAKLRAERSAKKDAVETAKAGAGGRVNYKILEGKTETEARALCGLRGLESLNRLFAFLDADGAATRMRFWDQRHHDGRTGDGDPKEQRAKVFRGVNGLFFTLIVLRTAVPLVVLSALFGVHQTTGGRAFTTWINFLNRSLAPMVRLPTRDEVDENAPDNFLRQNLGSVVMLLDASEIRIHNSWNTDLNWLCYSSYKGGQTGKILIGTTPGGAICFVGEVYPGGMSDVEVVKADKVVDKMKEAGLANNGCQLMADRGFNSMSPSLIRAGIHFVAPPWKRRTEVQFTAADMDVTREVANLRIHVERAIGALKTWRIVEHKFNHKQYDHITMCFRVVAALVNMTQQPFSSDK